MSYYKINAKEIVETLLKLTNRTGDDGLAAELEKAVNYIRAESEYNSEYWQSFITTLEALTQFDFD